MNQTTGGTDHYASMQTTLNRRFPRGLTLGAQWTLVGQLQVKPEPLIAQQLFGSLATHLTWLLLFGSATQEVGKSIR